MKLSSLFCQIGVVASLIDGLMKALVGIVVGIRGAVLRLVLAFLVTARSMARCSSVILRAASAPHMPSSAAIASKRSMISLRPRLATNAPRRACSSTIPVDASCISASRIGVRETPKRSARLCSSKRSPGCKRPVTISCSISSRSASARRITRLHQDSLHHTESSLRYAIQFLVYKRIDIAYHMALPKTQRSALARLLGWPEAMAWRLAKAGLEVER